MSIDFYREEGELGYLANYSPHGFSIDHVFYKTAEHFYQASKFDDPVLREKIISCETPREAACIGRDRMNPRIPNFKEKKLDVMYQGVLEKFRQNPAICDKLLKTGNEEIREMTDQESYWGMGPHMDGENHMGQILMKVREQLRKER